MTHRNLIEDLETRRVFAGTPVIALGPNEIYLNAVKGASSTYSLRIQNVGTGRLVVGADAFRVRGDNPGAFKVIDFPSTGRSIAAGATINVTIQFTAPTSTLNVQSASLRVASNDPRHPYRFEPLLGLPTAGEGGSLEPSLQKVVNFFGLGVDTGETDVNNYLYPTTPSSTSDEINAQTFVKAGAGDVQIKPLALFTNEAGPTVRMGFYTPGELDSEQYLWFAPSGSAQSVSPVAVGQTSFDPGTSTFGLVTQFPHFSNSAATTTTISATPRNVYSEKGLNSTWDKTSFNHFRVFPYIDQRGKTIANTYLVAEEEYTQDYDNQDLIFVVTNVKPATAAPTLSYQNMTGAPANDILSFNQLGTPNADVGNIVRDTNTLRVRNTGSAPLTINSSVTGDYSIASGGGSATIAVGATRDLTIRFTATATEGQHNGVLTLTSNDPDHPTTAISLLGVWQQYSEQQGPHTASDEPTAQTLVNKVLGYTTAIPTRNELKAAGGTIEKSGGDEILAEYFVAADTNAAVNVTELATFHSVTYTASDGTTQVASNSNLRWYPMGSPSSSKVILTDKVDTGQMVLPVSSASSSKQAAGSFDAKGQTFGFVVDQKLGQEAAGNGGEYSDYSLNYQATSTFGALVRFFPAKDADGKLIPNTYIVLHDYDKAATPANDDFQDNIYLISNIIPVGELKTPVTAYATHVADGVAINLTAPADGPRITGYNVYRSTTPDGVYALLTNTPLGRASNVNYIDYSARADTTYYYKITSLGTNLESRPVIVMA